MLKKALKSNRLLKILAVIAIIVLGLQPSYAQETSVEIGDKEGDTEQFPIDRHYNYSRWEGIYLSSEIGQSGYLTNIGFYMNGDFNGDDLTNIKIYVKLTDASSLQSGNFLLDGYTLVYEGSMYNLTDGGFVNYFKLMYPFYYNNSQNLQIAVEHGLQYPSENMIVWSFSYTEAANLSRSNSADDGLPDYLYLTEVRPMLRLGLGCLFIDPGKNKSICSGDSVLIGGDTVAIGGGGNYTYQWNPSESLNDATIANPMASPTSSQEYTVTVSSEGCTSQTSPPITVYVSGEGPEIKMGEEQQDVVSMCGGKFYDSGGNEEEYSYNEDYTLTIYPCDDLHKVVATFSEFDLENSEECNADWLKIYNGNIVNEEELIGTYCGNDVIGEISSTHLTGALTFVFHSNQEGSGYGWIADIDCAERSCEEIAGTATISSEGDGIHSGGAVLGLNDYLGTFVKWQQSYNGIDYFDYNTSLSPNTFNNTTTYYRAVVTHTNGTCYSNAVKYSTSNNYYVNDASLDFDIWCTAIGLPTNNGLSKDKPIDKLSSIITLYDLGPGDTIVVDSGVYADNILFGPTDKGSALYPIVVMGAGAEGKTSLNTSGTLVNFDNASDIEFRNIYLKCTSLYAIRIKNSNGIIINRCIIEPFRYSIIVQGTDKTQDLYSNRNRFYYNIFKPATNGMFSISGAVNDLDIDNNIFQSDNTYLYTNAILLSLYNNATPKNIKISSNYFMGLKTAVYATGAQTFPIENIKIKDNWITTNINSGNGAIMLNWVDTPEVSYNRIHGGDISIGLSNVSNLRIYNNFISNSATGIDVGQAASNLEIYNNSFYNSVKNINFLGLLTASNLFVQNNIFYNTSTSSNDYCLLMDESSNNGYGNQLDVCDNNLYYAPNGAKLAKFGGNTFSNLNDLGEFDHVIGTTNGDENSVTGDPGYFDTENGNLMLYESSVANARAADISWIPDDIDHDVLTQPHSLGASRRQIPSSPNGPFAELKRKLDGGYHLTNSGYLLIKYTEEYNPIIAKLKYKVYDNNRNVILSSTPGNPTPFNWSGNIPIKYGDNYCSIKLWSCISSLNPSGALPVGYYVLEVSNDKNEKWYLRFKQEYILPYYIMCDLPTSISTSHWNLNHTSTFE